MEVEGKSGVVFADVDEIEYVILMLNEAFDEKGGGKERVGVEVASVHVYEESGLQESLVGLIASLDSCLRSFIANSSSFYILEGSRWHSSNCFLVPRFRRSILSIPLGTGILCLVSCDL